MPPCGAGRYGGMWYLDLEVNSKSRWDFIFLPLAHTSMHLSAKKLFAVGEKDEGYGRDLSTVQCTVLLFIRFASAEMV